MPNTQTANKEYTLDDAVLMVTLQPLQKEAEAFGMVIANRLEAGQYEFVKNIDNIENQPMSTARIIAVTLVAPFIRPNEPFEACDYIEEIEIGSGLAWDNETGVASLVEKDILESISDIGGF